MTLHQLRHRPGQTLVLVMGLCVALLLPLFSWQGVSALREALLDRARQSPLLVGPPGSRTDLVMGALFFRGQVQDALTVGQVQELRERADGVVLPLGLNASAQGLPLVGTEPDYLTARGLALAEGRRFAVVGEVVAGSATGLRVGDSLRTDVVSVYDVQASSLLVEVVGVLQASGGPDDQVLLTGLSTTWAVQGLLHGHEATDQADPSLFLFDRVDPDTLAGFHGHGEQLQWPIQAAVLLPVDDRERDLVLAEWSQRSDLQVVQPERQVEEILTLVLRLRRGLAFFYGAVAASTLALVGLIVSLSVRLRRSELVLLRRLGASRAQMVGVVAAELGVVSAVAAALAVALSALLVQVLSRCS